MKYIVTLNGKKYEVEVERGQATAVYAGQADPAPAVAPVATPAAPPSPARGEDVVTAPMPGTILNVRCQVGCTVKAGDILFILEAMKMENEICAPHDGTLTEICVNQGSTVDTGTALCRLT